MDIAFILPNLPFSPTGGFKVVFDYADFLSEEGNDVTIYYDVSNFLKKRIKWKTLRIILSKLILVIKICPKWYKFKNKINQKAMSEVSDIKIHDRLIATAVNTAYILNCVKMPDRNKFYFIQGYETWLMSKEEVIQSYSFKMTKIVVSNWLKNIVAKYNQETIHLVCNGIDLNNFKINTVIGERYKHSIIFHFRKLECKGSNIAISVIKKLKEMFKDLSVDVVGTEHRRPDELPEYCNYYHDINSKKVSLLNNKNRVFLCTSIEEGFGLPGLEAMACGCVLVTTDFLGSREYARNRENALVAQIGNINDLVKLVKELFDNEGLQYMLSFNAQNTVKKFEQSRQRKLFRDILEIKRGAIDAIN